MKKNFALRMQKSLTKRYESTVYRGFS